MFRCDRCGARFDSGFLYQGGHYQAVESDLLDMGQNFGPCSCPEVHKYDGQVPWVTLSVHVQDADMSPIRIQRLVEAALDRALHTRINVGGFFVEPEASVDIEEHSGPCSEDYCGGGHEEDI